MDKEKKRLIKLYKSFFREMFLGTDLSGRIFRDRKKFYKGERKKQKQELKKLL